MTIITNTPGAIEGESIHITGQKIVPLGRPKKSSCGAIFYPLSVKIRGEGQISVEFNPKKFKIRSYSKLEEGAIIKGKELYGHTSLPIKSITKGGGGRTSAHTGQEVYINNCCYLEIVSGLYGLPLSLHPKNDIYLNV